MTAPELMAALDREPGELELLHALGQAAASDERWVDELFERFARARPQADRRKLRWSEVCHAALFHRLDVIAEALDDADFVLIGDPLRRAKIGGLLLELGRFAAAADMLAGNDDPLAVYHLHRQAVRDGEAELAARLLGELPSEGSERLLRHAAEARGGISAGELDAARRLVGWWKGPADIGRTASHLAAEVILVEIELWLVERRRELATGASIFLVASPARFDPSAILRATALLGPLPRRFA